MDEFKKITDKNGVEYIPYSNKVEDITREQLYNCMKDAQDLASFNLKIKIMNDTKINILRNLMVPIVNYFLLLEKGVLSPRDAKLLRISRELSVLNMEEICEILEAIPEDACEKKP